MASGIRFLSKPWRFFNQLKTDFSHTSSRAILSCRQSSTTSKVLSVEEARSENWRRRVDLAASYRIFEKFNLHEGVCNHLSMMAPAANGEGEVMLIVPYGLHWSEVKASSFVGLNEKREVVEGQGEVETSASTIHTGVHLARPDAVCAYHLHPPYCTAIGSLKNPKLRMVHQNSCLFYNRIAYDRDYSGLSTDDEEGMRTARQLGDKSVLFMCNHGVMAVAPNAAKAIDDIYYLERAAMTQVLAMSTGQELFELPDELAKLSHQQLDGPGIREPFYNALFESLKRILAKECPDYME
ncbi:LOW QUALITY PROTEIN: putative aldolase class 2 protein CC_1201 [Oculina patagonica]